MSRPLALGLVLLVLILTSQSDWKTEQKQETEENTSSATKKDFSLSNRGKVKKEIILIQEKEIHKLKLKLKGLEEQLRMCQCDVRENTTGKIDALERASNVQMKREDDLVQPLLEKSTKLRGSVRKSRIDDLSERPSQLQPNLDAIEMADDEEEKLGDR